MGESKRRKKNDPNYGKFNIVAKVCEYLDNFFIEQFNYKYENTFAVFTNNDRGCKSDEIDLIKLQIPRIYKDRNFTLWILPQEYAFRPVHNSFNKLIPINIGNREVNCDAKQFLLDLQKNNNQFYISSSSDY